jgi:nicotinamidase/pyrazinamidase
MDRYAPGTALIIVDAQNDFADPDGSLSVPGAAETVAAINREVSAAILGGAILVATQDWHPERTPHFVTDGGPWPVHCVGGTWGAALYPSLELPEGVALIRKGASGEDGYSGFTMRDPQTGQTTPTALEGLLRQAGVEAVAVVGLATDYCVKATALDAVDLGFETSVLTDAVAAVNVQPGDGDRALDELRSAGVEVRKSLT